MHIASIVNSLKIRLLDFKEVNVWTFYSYLVMLKDIKAFYIQKNASLNCYFCEYVHSTVQADKYYSV